MVEPESLEPPPVVRFAGLVRFRRRRWGVVARFGVLELTSEAVSLFGRDGELQWRCAPAKLRVRRVWPRTVALEHDGQVWFVEGFNQAHLDPQRDPPKAIELAQQFDAMRLPPPVMDAGSYKRATSTPEGQSAYWLEFWMVALQAAGAETAR